MIPEIADTLFDIAMLQLCQLVTLLLMEATLFVMWWTSKEIHIEINESDGDDFDDAEPEPEEPDDPADDWKCK